MYKILHPNDYYFDIRDCMEMGDYHGRTGKNFIHLREDVYDGACFGNGRDRFTAAHELGHYIFHRDYIGLLHRQICTSETKSYCNSEWQANTFASELLMPACLFERCRCIEEVQEYLGVTYSAAIARNDILLRDGLITKSLC
ncbi:ImmA/IrrE family metallo-endopeptidase [Entomomonas asaccharolytica]|uniref:ImmA/IrrE family metallo-endopeptidase n=1 Tax=Entomomonas asaccharolytica TaxID=2785331 RepID=A0A974NE78_9GAMM|nr:ImmA/IrrE family metallo-endopeptidase [Entomomonas asaccharolytica]QQP85048.1 ImmA/IrrE family metallo-endopeptidase [Entomomonas asaccharolytica]